MRPVFVTILLVFAGLLASANSVRAQEDSSGDSQDSVQEHADTSERAKLLGRIEAYLNGVETLKADFVQGTPDGETRRGTLSLHRPGRLRFDYTDDTPRLLVSDGEVLTFVDYDLGQVTRWPIDDTPLGLLVEDEIALAGDPRVVSVEHDAGAGHIVLKARDPERPDQGTARIVFEETGSGLQLAGWRVQDGRNTVTVVRLQDMRRDLALAESLWEFEDPRKLPSQRRRRRR